MKRLYYRDNYGKYPEGYLLAHGETSFKIDRKAYVRANSRCTNGCAFMTDNPVYIIDEYGREVLIHSR